MADKNLQRRSILEPALLELAAYHENASVILRETPFQGQLILRALDELDGLNTALTPVLGTALDATPNRVNIQGKLKIFWLRPRQWLVVTPPEKHAETLQAIENALSAMDSSVVDNSDGHTMLCLEGEKAADVIKKGCPLDIHPRVFPAGSMALTRIVHTDILLHHAKENQFDIYVRNSFGEYLLRWLFDAAHEYGIYIDKGEKK